MLLPSLAQGYSAQSSHVSICIQLHDYSILHKAFEVLTKAVNLSTYTMMHTGGMQTIPVIIFTNQSTGNHQQFLTRNAGLIIKYRHKSQKHLIWLNKALSFSQTTSPPPFRSEREEAHKRVILTKGKHCSSARALKKNSLAHTKAAHQAGGVFAPL